MSRLKDLPRLLPTQANLRAVVEAMLEALRTFRGYQGDYLDRALTMRDFATADAFRLLISRSGGGGVLGDIAEATAPDLTPPPTPTGLVVTAGISHVYFEHDTPVYTQGHGHDRTIVYGAKVTPSLPTPVFADAVQLCDFQGTFGAYPSDPATTWAIWIQWESNDGVLSTSPAGGTNGSQASTGQDVRTLLDALSYAARSGPYAGVEFRAASFRIMPAVDFEQEATPTGTAVGQLWYKPSTSVTTRWNGSTWASFSAPLPFLVQTAPTTINGVTIPAGVYMDSAFIYDLTASIARLGNAWIDNAKIADVSAAKLTAGSLGVGSYIRSTVYTPGLTGWTINADGTAELGAAYIRGQLTAAQIGVTNLAAINADMGNITGGTITLSSTGHIKGGQTAYNTGTGFFLGYSGGTYKLSIGDGTLGLTWDGTALKLNGKFVAAAVDAVDTPNVVIDAMSEVYPVDGTSASISTSVTVPSGETYDALVDGWQTAWASGSGSYTPSTLTIDDGTTTFETQLVSSYVGIASGDGTLPSLQYQSGGLKALFSLAAGTHTVTLTGESGIYKVLTITLRKR